MSESLSDDEDDEFTRSTTGSLEKSPYRFMNGNDGMGKFFSLHNHRSTDFYLVLLFQIYLTLLKVVDVVFLNRNSFKVLCQCFYHLCVL